MWVFFSRRLRMWLLLAIALPLSRALVHRLALAAGRRDSSTRTARALHHADSAVTAVSRRAARKGRLPAHGPAVGGQVCVSQARGSFTRCGRGGEVPWER
jgi:hypothetical protein